MDNNTQQPEDQAPSQPAEQPAPEQQVAEQPVAEQPVAQQQVAEQPVQNQPIMEQPMGQPMPGQPMMQPMPGQPMGQPYPYQQPAMKPPKQPMSPEKKKKLILWLVIGGVVLTLGIVAAIVVPILLKVSYRETYEVAKELKPKIQAIYNNYDCDYVVDYLTSTYTTPKVYGEYVESCKSVYNSGVTDLITKLENTDGVKRNNEIKLQFDRFKSEYASLSEGDSEALAAKLSLWQSVHNFNYAADDITVSSPDVNFKTAANYLIESGNDELKAYGEGWLERALEVAAAYRAYQASSWQTSSEMYSAYTAKRNEFSSWRQANLPSISSIAPLNFDDSSKMKTEFTTLYDLIVATYEKNYDYGSGVCMEFMGVVSCE